MNIKEFLIQKDITGIEFAKTIGISRPYLYLIMTGKKVPSQQLAKRIEDLTLGKITKNELRNKENLMRRYRKRIQNKS